MRKRINLLSTGVHVVLRPLRADVDITLLWQIITQWCGHGKRHRPCYYLHTPEGIMDYCQGLKERRTDFMMKGFEEKGKNCYKFHVPNIFLTERQRKDYFSDCESIRKITVEIYLVVDNRFTNI